MTPNDKVRTPDEVERPEVGKEAVKDLEPTDEGADVRGGEIKKNTSGSATC